jgi:hypothetical protein
VTEPTINWDSAAQHFSDAATALFKKVSDQIKADGPKLTQGTYDTNAFVADVTWFWKTLSETATDVGNCWTATLGGK